jgi:hypothetical protein
MNLKDKVLAKKAIKRIFTLLPWYVNDTLPTDAKVELEASLQTNPEAQAELARWRLLQTAISSQHDQEPARAVRYKTLARVRALSQTPRLVNKRSSALLDMLLGVSLTCVFLLLLWTTVKPGIVLQWSVSGGPLTSFHIYRAPLGSQDYDLVRSLNAQPNEAEYTYVDTFLLPGRTYVYRVEGLEPGGTTTLSQAITSDSKGVLVGQLVILFASLCMGASAMMLVRSLHSFFPMRLGGSY